ncbi:MAG: helix-turn-helix domain-containing protein [Lachnospiraceae bacterium]|nr:helix-turn-helix domain-containing protein [Lachnospiraceae bacterium]MDE6984815.1 helix-turn-helix domain-containing protein [Lachnospiraceae bacterium]MDE7028776.1 helix-turn-helix domain-containing protein [Lachnospiraceae bacterium]
MRYARLKNLREDSDLTQTRLAERLQCSQRIYSDYERGKVDIPTEILIRLALIYGTSIDYLLELTDEKTPYARKEKGQNWPKK